jgi:hypothetical protein
LLRGAGLASPVPTAPPTCRATTRPGPTTRASCPDLAGCRPAKQDVVYLWDSGAPAGAAAPHAAGVHARVVLDQPGGGACARRSPRPTPRARTRVMWGEGVVGPGGAGHARGGWPPARPRGTRGWARCLEPACSGSFRVNSVASRSMRWLPSVWVGGVDGLVQRAVVGGMLGGDGQGRGEVAGQAVVCRQALRTAWTAPET